MKTKNRNSKWDGVERENSWIRSRGGEKRGREGTAGALEKETKNLNETEMEMEMWMSDDEIDNDDDNDDVPGDEW